MGIKVILMSGISNLKHIWGSCSEKKRCAFEFSAFCANLVQLLTHTGWHEAEPFFAIQSSREGMDFLKERFGISQHELVRQFQSNKVMQIVIIGVFFLLAYVFPTGWLTTMLFAVGGFFLGKFTEQVPLDDPEMDEEEKDQ